MNEFQEEIIDTELATEESKKEKKRNKAFKKGVLTGVLCTILILGAVVAGVAIYFARSLGSLGLEGFSLGKLKYITGLINYYYYEDPDPKALGEGVYKGVMEGLKDPYSVYYTKNEYEDMMIDTTGNYAGIGAVLSKNVETGQVTVISIYKGTPAEKAGLQAGDIIVSVDGHRGESEELDSFVRHIRGEEGTKIVLEYEREGKQDVVEITRAQVKVPSVEYEMMPGKIGYIAIADFSSNTKEQYDEAMKDLQAQGMKAVIFDLRYNGGGLVDSVVEVLDEILPEGITVYMEDKNGERTDYTSDGEHYLDMPIAVLTSENTASAAEIFAGAIRDYEYGTLIGTKTYGKGIVQSTVPLSDGSAIKITIASYFTPSGECIHKKGIKPDVELEYEFMGGDDEEYSTALDNQIQKACEILRQEME